MDGLSCLPIEDAPPEGKEAALLLQTLSSEEAPWQAAQELYRATHVGMMPSESSLGTVFLTLGAKKFALR